MGTRDPRRRIIENPFYVLGLTTQCSRAEAEREGQKLLDMLAVGLSTAKTYRSPLGVHDRTAETIREAMAELRDPERRLIHELWAQVQPQQGLQGQSQGPDKDPGPDKDKDQTPGNRAHEAGQAPMPPAKAPASTVPVWRGGAAIAGWRRP